MRFPSMNYFIMTASYTERSRIFNRNQLRFESTVIAEDPASAFKDDELDEGVRVVFEHHGGPGDRCGHGRGVDLRSTGVLWHAQKHGAAAELEIARALIERKNGVRAEAGESLVGKGELGA